jgi:hypothetical protein
MPVILPIEESEVGGSTSFELGLQLSQPFFVKGFVFLFFVFFEIGSCGPFAQAGFELQSS